MADVFEVRADLDLWRERLWALIEATPALDWLLLTKRPDQIALKAPWRAVWPKNVWLGTTTENQVWASRRVPALLEHPAAVRFVSCEPLVGPLDISEWLSNGINWVIAGGESGPKARPMNPEWARALRDQCLAAGVAFHFKQWGHWAPDANDAPANAKRVTIKGKEGNPITLVKLAKKTAGRSLDGEVWNQFPQPRI